VLGLVHQMTFKALIRQEDVDSERNVVLNGVCVYVLCVCVCMCAYVCVAGR
jgi:hypothetical protein